MPSSWECPPAASAGSGRQACPSCAPPAPQEAEARGLLGAPKKGTKAALVAEAEARGIEVPEGATKAEIEELLDEEE